MLLGQSPVINCMTKLWFTQVKNWILVKSYHPQLNWLKTNIRNTFVMFPNFTNTNYGHKQNYYSSLVAMSQSVAAKILKYTILRHVLRGTASNCGGGWKKSLPPRNTNENLSFALRQSILQCIWVRLCYLKMSHKRTPYIHSAF